MKAERLVEIKKRSVTPLIDSVLSPMDSLATSRIAITELVAEVERLKEEGRYWYAHFINTADSLGEEIKETARLRKALEFYADEETYDCLIEYDEKGEPYAGDVIVKNDGGKIAREALKHGK